MLTAMILAACVAGGFVAGVVALAVGGLGVLLSFRRQLAATADAIDQVDLKVEREIKRRAGDARPTSNAARALGPLASVQTIPPHDEGDNVSRAEILRRAGL